MIDPYVVERKLLRRPGYPEIPNTVPQVIPFSPMTQAMQPDDVLIIASIRRNPLYTVESFAFGQQLTTIALADNVQVEYITGQSGIPTISQKIYNIVIDVALWGVALIVRGLNVPYVGGSAQSLQCNLVYPSAAVPNGVPTPLLPHSPGTFALFAVQDFHSDTNGFTVMQPTTDWVSQLNLAENVGATRRMQVQTHIGLVPEYISGAYKNLTASPTSCNGVMVVLGQAAIPVDFVGWGTPI